jgi:hypothetical protein
VLGSTTTGSVCKPSLACSLVCADSEHDARERSTAELGATSASQALRCRKHESSSRATGVARPLSDSMGHVRSPATTSTISTPMSADWRYSSTPEAITGQRWLLHVTSGSMPVRADAAATCLPLQEAG